MACLYLGRLEGKKQQDLQRQNKRLGKTLYNVIFVSFSSLKANRLTSAFSYNDGWRHPLICMGVME